MLRPRYIIFVLILTSQVAYAVPCLEYYRRKAEENNKKPERNDEKIAIEMLLDEKLLEAMNTESYYFLKNALKKLEKDKVESNFKEIQAHIYAGFKKAKFCKDGKPHKSAGQIIRYAKDEVEDHWFERLRYAKILFEKQKPQLDFNKERNTAAESKSK
jgi:hypothetical protein